MNDPRAKKYFAKMPHVDQDPTHALWWAYADKPFDKKFLMTSFQGHFFKKQPMPKQRIRQKAALLTL